MAKVKTFSEFPVKETIHVPPSEFVNLLTEDSRIRGRYQSPDESKVQSLAISIREDGQQSAVLARRDGKSELHLIAGFTRAEAIELNRVGFIHKYEDANGKPKEKKYDPMPTFLVRANVIECDDATARKQNALENGQRSDLTTMDYVVQVDNLEYDGLKGREIAEILGVSPSKISRIKSLQDLSENAKTALHNGTLSENAAVEMVKESNKLDHSEHDGLLVRHDNAPTIVQIQEYVRTRAAVDADAEGENAEGEDPEGGVLPVEKNPRQPSVFRTGKQIRELLEECVLKPGSKEQVLATAGERIVSAVLANVLNFANGGTYTTEKFLAEVRLAGNKIDGAIVVPG